MKQDLKETKVNKVKLDLKEKLDLKVKLDHKVIKDHKERQGLKDL